VRLDTEARPLVPDALDARVSQKFRLRLSFAAISKGWAPACRRGVIPELLRDRTEGGDVEEHRVHVLGLVEVHGLERLEVAHAERLARLRQKSARRRR